MENGSEYYYCLSLDCKNTNQKLKLPKLFNCPSCHESLELSNEEQLSNKFTCPECNQSIDLSEKGIAKALYVLSVSNAEESMNLYEKLEWKFKPLNSNEIWYHILILHLFICDFMCFQKFGNSKLKNKILNDFYEEIKNNLKGDSNLIKSIYSEINRYGAVVRNKSFEQVLVSVGTIFSNSVNVPNDINIIMSGAHIFGRFSIIINKFLDNLNGVSEIFSGERPEQLSKEIFNNKNELNVLASDKINKLINEVFDNNKYLINIDKRGKKESINSNLVYPEWFQLLDNDIKLNKNNINKLEDVRKELNIPHADFAQFICGSPLNTYKTQYYVLNDLKIKFPNYDEKQLWRIVLETRKRSAEATGINRIQEGDIQEIIKSASSFDDIVYYIVSKEFERPMPHLLRKIYSKIVEASGENNLTLKPASLLLNIKDLILDFLVILKRNH